MKTNIIAPITKIPLVSLFLLGFFILFFNTGISHQWVKVIVLFDGICALIILTCIGLLYCYIERAILVHITYTFSLVVAAFPLYFLALDLIEKAIPPLHVFLIFVNTIVISMVLKFVTTRKKVFEARKYNQKSGLLDIENGRWNIKNQFFVTSPEEQEEKNKSWNRIKDIILPLAPIAGNVVYLSTDTNILNFTDVVFLLFAISMFAYVSALHLVIAYDLFDIEKSYKKRIVIGK